MEKGIILSDWAVGTSEEFPAGQWHDKVIAVGRWCTSSFGWEAWQAGGREGTIVEFMLKRVRAKLTQWQWVWKGDGLESYWGCEFGSLGNFLVVENKRKWRVPGFCFPWWWCHELIQSKEEKRVWSRRWVPFRDMLRLCLCDLQETLPLRMCEIRAQAGRSGVKIRESQRVGGAWKSDRGCHHSRRRHAVRPGVD